MFDGLGELVSAGGSAVDRPQLLSLGLVRARGNAPTLHRHQRRTPLPSIGAAVRGRLCRRAARLELAGRHTPADQTVSDLAAFNTAIQAAVREVERGTIVISGVMPDAPEAGYGYIKVDGSLRFARDDASNSSLRGGEADAATHKTLAFTEEPSL